MAEATTAKGRDIINFTKMRIENDFDQAPGCKVIYGDTDSAFVRLPPELQHIEEENIYNLGTAMAAFVTKAFLDSLPNDLAPFCQVNLEMEKYLQPSIFYKKKRYVGKSFEHLGKQGKLLIKGLELVRRDAIPLVKTVQADIVDALLTQANPHAAVEIAKAAIKRIMSTPCGGPFHHLMLSKSLRSEYKNPQGMAHLAVANRMDMRNTGSAPRIGDRVEYVIVASQDSRVVDKAEDVKYAEAHSLPPDWYFYLESLERPVLRLLEVPLRSDHFLKQGLYEDLMRYFQIEKNEASKMRLRFGRVCKEDGSWIEGIKCKDGKGVQPSLLSCLQDMTSKNSAKTEPEIQITDKSSQVFTITFQPPQSLPQHTRKNDIQDTRIENVQDTLKNKEVKSRSKKRNIIVNDPPSKKGTLHYYTQRD